MMQIAKISAFLHSAADKFLPHDDPRYGFSCEAFRSALNDALAKGEIGLIEYHELVFQFVDGIEALGLDFGSMNAFDDVPYETRQAARYQWLKFCALLAEEQGE
jgi:hypothetical protein